MAKKKSETKKERIAEAATDIFIKKGYNGSSLQDIAQAVGISKAGIYHYFKTKEEILYHILSTHHEKNIKTYAGIRKVLEGSDLDSVTTLKKLIRSYSDLTASRQSINLLAMRERHQLTGVHRENYHRLNKKIFNYIKRDIRKIDGLKKDLDVNTILFMFIAMSNWFAYWFKEDGKMTLDEAIKQTADIICHGVMEG